MSSKDLEYPVTSKSKAVKESATAHDIVGGRTSPGVVRATKEFAGKPRKTYKAGRTCKIVGCYTKLSIYNSEKYCYQHRTERESKLRRNSEGGNEGYVPDTRKR